MARADETRIRILDEALRLLVQGGRDAVSTRAITAAANIQAPTLYRIFGDKHGLLDAVAAYGFAGYIERWQVPDPRADPIDAIRRGWDLHVGFGIENPYLYSIAYGDAHPGVMSGAATSADAILTGLVERAAAEGRIGIPVVQAVHLLHAAGVGVVLTLLSMPEAERDDRLSERAREAALAAIVTDPSPAAGAGRSGTAMQLRAHLDETAELSPSERALLGDWLDRIAAGA